MLFMQILKKIHYHVYVDDAELGYIVYLIQKRDNKNYANTIRINCEKEEYFDNSSCDF